MEKEAAITNQDSIRKEEKTEFLG